MNSGMISMRYARALFDYAKDNQMEDKVFAEMKSLVANFTQERKFRVALDNPVLSVNDKLNLIKLAAGNDVSDVFVQFIKLVLDRRREDHLQRMGLMYLDLYRNYKNISVGKLITATPVDSAVIEKIKQLVHQKKSGTIDFVTEVDPSIDGGFILFIDTYRLDASIASQLKNIKQQLLSKNKKIA